MVSAGEVAEILAGLGGLGGVAALFSAWTAVRTSRKAEESAEGTRKAATAMLGEFKPDHGNSLRDRVDGIEATTKVIADEVRVLASSIDQYNDIVRDRLKAHDRELDSLRSSRDANLRG